MRDVAVIGVGETEFGELWDRSFRDLGIEAGLKAIQDAKLRSEDIDAVYIGNMSAGKFIDQEHVSTLVADYAGLATCTSRRSAWKAAARAVRSRSCKGGSPSRPACTTS